MSKELARECNRRMAVGSKSFSLAARLFPRRERESARLLYSWCRHCDDEIDRATSPEAAKERLAILFKQTHSALAGKPQTDISFRAFQRVCQESRVPHEYPLELLRGMEMDVFGQKYATERELKLYCFRVASVVGLMMTHVMGVDKPEALKQASDAGMAMQMTNIARDVKEDHALGRVYLPREWFAAEGLEPLSADQDFDATRAWRVTERLLALADRYYDSGRAGLRRLPLSAAFAVAAAIEIYSEIGRIARKRRAASWDTRIVVSGPKKLWLALVAAAQIAKQIPDRILRPWRASAIDRVFSDWDAPPASAE